MKKLWLTLLCGLLMLGLVACGDDGRVVDDATPVWLPVSQTVYGADDAVRGSIVWDYNTNGTLAEILWRNEAGEVYRSRDYLYNQLGQLRQRNELGQSDYHEIVYDDLGRVLSSCSYDLVGDEKRLRGELQSYYDEDGVRTDMTNFYDENGALWQLMEMTYDERGNELTAVTTAVDGTIKSRVERTYDDEGNKLTHDQWDEDGVNISHSEFTYDERGNLLTSEGYNLANDVGNRVEYEYDAAGNMLRQTVKHPDSGDIWDYTTYEYDDAGRKVREVYYLPGVWADEWADEHHYTYDENGNLQKVEGVDESGRAYSRTEYAYKQVMVPAAQLELVLEQQDGLIVY